MKILHLSSSDIAGGAARAAHRLHRGLLSSGHDSHMLVGKKSADEIEVHQYYGPRGLSDRLYRKRRRGKIAKDWQKSSVNRPAGFDRFTDDRSAHGRLLLEEIHDYDIVNLHWVSEFVDLGEVLPELTSRVPVVWTLHDMNAMTGGCHYDAGCGRYQTQCGSCPQLGSTEDADLSRQIFDRKAQAFGDIDANNLTIVTPSEWLGSCAESSTLLGKFSRQVIPYGLNLDDFTPRDRAFSRDTMRIPRDAKVLLFVADYMDNSRKGVKLLMDALTLLEDDDVLCITVGDSRGVTIPEGINVQQLGRLSDDRIVSLAYSAADIFVCPSHQDNLPNTVLESISCGTPCVAFDVGGMPDMIKEGETGWLAECLDSKSLSAAIDRGLKDLSHRGAEIARSCSERAQQHYDLAIQPVKYAELYENMITQFKS